MFRLAWRGKGPGKTTVMSVNKKPGRVQFKSRLKEVSIRFCYGMLKKKACSIRKHSRQTDTTEKHSHFQTNTRSSADSM